MDYSSQRPDRHTGFLVPWRPELPAWQPELLTTEQEESAQLRNYWRTISKRFRLVIAILCTTVALTLAVCLVLRPQYTSTSVVMIEPHTPQVLEIKEPLSEEDQPVQATEDGHYYESQYRILQSRSLAAKVIRELNFEDTLLHAPPRLRLPAFIQTGLDDLAADVSRCVKAVSTLILGPIKTRREIEVYGVSARAIDTYLKNLEVKPGQKDRLVEVSFSWLDPETAARVTNAHVAAYIGRGMEIHAQTGQTAEAYLNTKLAEIKDNLERSEATLNNYRRSKGIVTPTLDDKSRMIMERYAALSDEMMRVRSERLALEAQVTVARMGQYESLPAAVSDPLVQKLKVDVAELSTDYKGMLNHYYEKYPPLSDLKAKLDESRARLNAEISNIIHSLYDNYKSQLMREQALQKQLDKLQGEIMALNDASLQDAALTREVESNQQLYQSMLGRLKEIGVSSQVPTTNVSVIDKGEVPTDASSPRVLLSLALSGFLGLFLGVGAVSLIDYLDDRLESTEEVELYLRLPCLGAVPDFALVESRARSLNPPLRPALNGSSVNSLLSGNDHGGRNGAGALADSAGATVVRTPDGVLDTIVDSNKGGTVLLAQAASNSRELVVIDPLSRAADVYRTIRTGLLFSRAGSPPKSILVASAMAGEGKTVTAINLALAFAQSGRRTALVDADLRGARCHSVLSTEKRSGLSEVLVGQLQLKDALSPTAVSNLFLLCAGLMPPNPTDLLGSARMKEVLAELAQNFDYIVVDSFPVLPASDAIILSTMVDGVVLLVGSNTARQIARNAASRFAYVGAKVLGAVLNRTKFDSNVETYYWNHDSNTPTVKA